MLRVIFLQLGSSVFCFFLAGGSICAQPAGSKIVVNQMGYYPTAPKLAVVTIPTNESAFFICSTIFRDTLFRGSIGEEHQSAYSKTITRFADFSNFRTPGTYMLTIAGIGYSNIFRVGINVMKTAARAVRTQR